MKYEKNSFYYYYHYYYIPFINIISFNIWRYFEENFSNKSSIFLPSTVVFGDLDYNENI